MRKVLLFGGMTSVLAGALFLFAARVDAGQPRVDICHHANAQKTFIIAVAPEAVPGHQRHGDWRVSAEVCDGRDNDCNGVADDNLTDVGGECDTGRLGVCAAGVERCIDGELVCTPVGQPTPEQALEACTDRLDNDCDGLTDCADPDCAAVCAPDRCANVFCDPQRVCDPATGLCVPCGTPERPCCDPDSPPGFQCLTPDLGCNLITNTCQPGCGLPDRPCCDPYYPGPLCVDPAVTCDEATNTCEGGE